jgi:ligand-binding SRPBCC domain-containing protein
VGPGSTTIERRFDGSYHLASEVRVAAPPAEAFAHVSDADNLDAALPGFLGIEIVTPRPIEMGIGTEIRYRLRLHGLPVRWESVFVEWLPPDRFTYVQRRGPFVSWRHDHHFVPDGRGARILDDVVYEVPTGRLAHTLIVRRDLERLFAHRAEHLARVLTEP